MFLVLSNFDIVLAVSNSGASIDAYLKGMPLIIYKDNSKIDFSPWKEHAGSFFYVKNLLEIEKAINSCKSLKIEEKSYDLLWLNEEMPKWRYFLNDSRK